MKRLYARLKDVGYDSKFVRECVLPEWWSDDLATVPANRAMAEIAISRMLGFSITELRDSERRLKRPVLGGVRLKRIRGSRSEDVTPAILLAQQAARTIVAFLSELPSFSGERDPRTIRDTILTTNPAVDLGALVEYAWANGIAVLHLARLPKLSKKFAGLAMFCDDTPVDVLASGSDSPPWLAFHLAHELGHIMLGHVSPGEAPLADGEFSTLGDEGSEKDADRFALQLLTGDPEPQSDPIPGLTAPKLVTWARNAERVQGVSAGTVALVYGLTAGRMPAAQSALKLMHMDRGAKAIIAGALQRRLPEDLPETVRQFAALAGAA